jgi:hypothetical protein
MRERAVLDTWYGSYVGLGHPIKTSNAADALAAVSEMDPLLLCCLVTLSFVEFGSIDIYVPLPCRLYLESSSAATPPTLGITPLPRPRLMI